MAVFQFYSILILVEVFPFLELASVNSHSNRLVSKHFSKDVFDSDSEVCRQEAKCIPLQNATCFGTTLPYSFTSIALAEDSISQFEVQDNLALWHGLRSVPKCWAVVQPFLCAVYMPKCENGSVYLPSQEMCRFTRGPCKSVEVKHNWPPFLQCENKKLFPPGCRNPLKEVKFNTSYKCVPPLVETDNPNNQFYEVIGCGIQCQNPFFSEEEHNFTHTLIVVLAVTCCGMTLFTVATFWMNWKTAHQYPAKVIFYINVCLMFASIGWIFQIVPGARDAIVCSSDGTIHRKQPESWCAATFVFVYYSLMASVVWFVHLTYAWYVLFKQNGTPKDIAKRASYFHISAWCLPLVLSVAVLAMKEVDGDSMSGICFVGYANITMRIVFLLIPITIAFIIGSFFLFFTLCTLFKVKLKGEEVAYLQVKEIHYFLIKIGLFFICTFIFMTCTIVCHIYDFWNRKDWDESLRDYIVCLAMNSANRYPSIEEPSKCALKSKPNVGLIYLHLMCFFGYGIMMSLLALGKDVLKSWKQKFCGSNEKSAVVLKKHQLIARAYQNPHEVNPGRMPFGYEESGGMNLDASSVISNDISSSWLAAFPRFLVRRNAISTVMPVVPRQYSSASDMSRHMSMDSFNQQNHDSWSMHMSEQEFHAFKTHQRRKTRKERERFLKANRIAPWYPGNRRGSDTSLQSSLMAASIAVAAAKRAGAGAKVTKATSTGDLGIISPQGSVMFPPVMMLPVNNRPNIQRPAVNPPFTHGMTDNSHRLDSRVPSVSSALPGVNSNQRFTPSQCSVVPNSVMGMIRQPMYGGSYDVLNSVPYGYMGGSMYPTLNGMYLGYPFNPEYMYNLYGAMQYSFNPYGNQFQPDILPMNPMPDSASETDFPSIRITDSDYTDTGMRSYDESQLMTTARLVQEHLEATAAAAAAAQSVQPQPKQGLEPQECAKTKFLKRMGSFDAKTHSAASQTSRPPSGRKSPHSEAPPPSPVDSTISLNEAELDDVFDDAEETQKNALNMSLPHVSSETENIFKKMRSKCRRAMSFMYNLEKQDTFELTSKPYYSSQPSISQKEKCLHASEGISLINGGVTTENISR